MQTRRQLKTILITLLLALSIIVSAQTMLAQSCCSVPVTVSGRVLRSDGYAIRSALVTFYPQTTGATYSGYSNSFGYYQVTVPSDAYYAVTATARGYTFPAYIVSVYDNVSGFNLTAN